MQFCTIVTDRRAARMALSGTIIGQADATLLSPALPTVPSAKVLGFAASHRAAGTFAPAF